MTAMRSLILAGILAALAIGAAAVFVLTRTLTPVELDVANPQTAETEQPEISPVTPPPTFDIVRIDPAGTAVIAGRGMPGWQLRILGNDETISERRLIMAVNGS